MTLNKYTFWDLTEKGDLFHLKILTTRNMGADTQLRQAQAGDITDPRSFLSFRARERFNPAHMRWNQGAFLFLRTNPHRPHQAQLHQNLGWDLVLGMAAARTHKCSALLFAPLGFPFISEL